MLHEVIIFLFYFVVGGMFPISMASEEQVNSYRQEERKIMNTTLSQYLDVCAGSKVNIALVETFIFICIQKPSTSLSSGFL